MREFVYKRPELKKWYFTKPRIMIKISVLVFLATVAVAYTAICCSQNDGKINLTEKASNSKTMRVTKATTTVPKPKIKPPVQKLQVLVLKVDEKKDRSLILDWKIGDGLDWKFLSVNNGEAKVVPAHKSLVFKYSSYLRDLCEKLSKRGIEKNTHMLSFPVGIVESLVKLLYKHKIVINASDYDMVMAAAKSIQIDGLIGISEEEPKKKHFQT